MHGMGDVHPTEARAKLLDRLPRILPPGLTKAFLATTGAEAVEAALKTAVVATGKPHFASFAGGYHGMSLGALSVCGLERFRAPFARAIGGNTLFLEYPRSGADSAEPSIERARAALAGRDDIAAVIVEPIQSRGGCIIPPPGFLAGLHAACKELGILLIFDEIYTGFGRTGTWFAAEYEERRSRYHLHRQSFRLGVSDQRRGRASRSHGCVAGFRPAKRSTRRRTWATRWAARPRSRRSVKWSVSVSRRARSSSASALGSRLERTRARERVVSVRGRGLMWGIQMRDAASGRRRGEASARRRVDPAAGGNRRRRDFDRAAARHHRSPASPRNRHPRKRHRRHLAYGRYENIPHRRHRITGERYSHRLPLSQTSDASNSSNRTRNSSTRSSLRRTPRRTSPTRSPHWNAVCTFSWRCRSPST